MNSQSGFDYFPSVIANEEETSEYFKKRYLLKHGGSKQPLLGLL